MEAFKNKVEFKKRVSEVNRVLNKYKNRVPIYLTKGKFNKTMEEYDKKKYLAHEDMKLISFIDTVKRNFNLQSEQALYLMVNDKTLINGTITIGCLYKKYKDDDGFLYISYYEENAFGI